MTATAYLPPVWRAVMDRRVVELYGGDVSRANILPRKRSALLDRWGVARTGTSIR